MADRYWLGIGGTDANDSANWGTASGDMGSAGASVPGASDVAIFDGQGYVKSGNAVDVASNAFTISSHGFNNNDRVWLIPDAGYNLPEPIQERTVYYIVNKSTHTFQLSESSGGSAIDITSEGLPSTSYKAHFVFDANFTANLTIGEVKIIESYAGTVTINAGIKVTISDASNAGGLDLNGELKAGGSNASIEFTGGAKSGYGTFMVKNRQYAKITNPQNLTYTYLGTQNPVTFDDGPYPNVDCQGVAGTAVTFSPEYATPTSTEHEYYDNGKASMYSLTVTGRASNPPLFKPNANTSNEYTDGAKKFKITSDGGFACTIDTFNGGFAEWDFQASSGGFVMPVTGSSTYGTAGSGIFKPQIRKVKLHAETAGHMVTLGQGEKLVCESLEIGDGCVLKGPLFTGTNSAEIHCVKPPKIIGSWNFSQVVPGIYRSPISLPVETRIPNLTPHTAHFRLQTSVSNFAPLSTYSLCPLDTTDFDTANAWTSGGTNYKWTVPRDGKYLVNFGIAIQHTTTSHYQISNLYLNGSGKKKGTFSQAGSGSPSDGTVLLDLNKGDYLQLYAYHNGGSSKSLIGDDTTPGSVFMHIMEIL